MMTFRVKLSSVNDVKEFVNITFKAEKDVDIKCGKYHIDGKSIMGIFELKSKRGQGYFLCGSSYSGTVSLCSLAH